MKIGIIFVFLGVLISLSAPTYAAERFTLGPWDVHPYMTIETVYNDNVFERKSDIDGETYTTTIPGVRLELPWDDHAVTLEYAINLIHFFEMWNEDQQLNDAFLMYAFNFRKFSLNLSNHFYEDYSIPSGLGRQDVNLFYKNISKATLGVTLNRLIFDVAYTNSITEYEEASNISDSCKDELQIIGYVQAFPKTRILFEADLERFKYDNINSGNLDSLELYIGADGKIAPKTTGIVKLGWRWLDYTETPNFTGDAVYVDIKHRFNDYNWTDIEIERREARSLYTTQNYYNVSKILVRFSKKLSWRLTGSISGSYQFDKYPPKADDFIREDDLFGADLSFNYQFWEDLTFNTAYEFTKKESNASDSDYVINEVSCKYDLFF